MSKPALDFLNTYRQEVGLSHDELWLRYFELGGMSTGLELEAFLFGVLTPSAHEHDVIAHAINERYVELGGNHPVAYSRGIDAANNTDDTQDDGGSKDAGAN